MATKTEKGGPRVQTRRKALPRPRLTTCSLSAEEVARAEVELTSLARLVLASPSAPTGMTPAVSVAGMQAGEVHGGSTRPSLQARLYLAEKARGYARKGLVPGPETRQWLRQALGEDLYSA